MADLILKNLCKTYPNGFEAIKDFNIHIKDKEFIVIIGPSGCGKSTILRMIAGLEDITSGELWMNQKKCNHVKPKDRDIAMVFQNFILYPHMTVRQNIAFGIKDSNLSKKEIEKKVNEIASLLDLEHLLEKKPSTLSGGQKQRTAIGRAIISHPNFFLMDEPLSNLDAKLRIQMRSIISQLHQHLKTTFIYVTHDQTEAMTLATRIIVLKNGIIQQIDTPQNLYNYPKNQFVASFIGSTPMNFIHGFVDCESNTARVTFENDIKLNLNELHSNALKKGHYHGKKVIVGIRPEHISIHQNESCHSYKTNIHHLETLGAEVNVYFSIGNSIIVSKTNTNYLFKQGDPVHFSIDPSYIHLFDKDTQLAIGDKI